MENTSPKPTNGMAIASMVLGILSILTTCVGIILGIIGLILGIVALNQIKQSGQSGRGMAIAGIICSSAGLVIYLLITLLYMGLFIYY